MARLKIRWVKSAIGYSIDQKRTLRALGFKKLNQTVEQEDMPSIRGMIGKVDHLVKYEVVK
jgi:large subunit ribosomal protein L30